MILKNIYLIFYKTLFIFTIVMGITVIGVAIKNFYMQKFYNREKEFAQLEKIYKQSGKTAQMTFVVGRRRIGKTSLLSYFAEDKKYLYFFVARKNEVLLCQEYVEEIKQKLQVEIYGEIKTFKDLFGYLMDLSATIPFILIIDEFQEFININASVYSEMQHIWDSKKDKSRINLILCGSVYTLMSRIFENSKEPLFGRATARMQVKPFTISTIKEILNDYTSDYKPDDLLAFYTFSGGVAKYIELFTHQKTLTFSNFLETIFEENSLFLEEGKNVLIDEFGKDYGNYFSILSLIASSKTERSEMESIMQMQLGGFLDRLENDFGIIQKVRPVFSKPGSRNVKYFIRDNFLNFWFRFIYKYRSAIEIGNLSYVKSIVKRDYKTYSGKILEKYFREKLAETGQFSLIGSYWEKGNQNEIDIIAIDEEKKYALFADVKRDASKINLAELKEKSFNIKKNLPNYKIDYKGYSLKDL